MPHPLTLKSGKIGKFSLNFLKNRESREIRFTTFSSSLSNGDIFSLINDMLMEGRHVIFRHFWSIKLMSFYNKKGLSFILLCFSGEKAFGGMYAWKVIHDTIVVLL